MGPSPFVRTEAQRGDRLSEAPHVLDSGASLLPPALGTASTRLLERWRELVSGMPRLPRAWVAMAGYLATGVALGLVLILLVSVLAGDGTGVKKTAAALAVTDDVVHLHARDIGTTCWRGAPDPSLAKLTVALEVGLDGKVRSAQARGDSPVMRGCVESHVRAWEFLPQAQSSQMVLPFEVDAR
ncbi:MAG: hypothetical protein JWP97_3218 [Labilithrix sp.]|nr:hypothetical protein [Labilithrix sp.]